MVHYENFAVDFMFPFHHLENHYHNDNSNVVIGLLLWSILVAFDCLAVSWKGTLYIHWTGLNWTGLGILYP